MSANTIFIIGAGATRAISSNSTLPSPLATDFFKNEYLKKFTLFDAVYDFNNSALKKIIEHYFGKKEDINIEEIYSFLDFIEDDFYYNFTENISLKRAKYELIEYLFHILAWEVDFDDQYYKKIISGLEKGDSIISFNWDIAMDTVLNNSSNGKKLLESLENLLNPNKIQEAPDYENVALDNFHKGYFLKMHGSINWGLCKNPECLRNDIPFIYNINYDFYPPSWECNYCGDKIEMMLMPPHVNKNFKTNRTFKLQAKIAYHKIRTAEKIVIIGYSFPDFDFEVNALVRKAKLSVEESEIKGSELFLKEIHLVDPAVKYPKFVEKIRSIFGLDDCKTSFGKKVELFKYQDFTSYMNSNYN